MDAYKQDRNSKDFWESQVPSILKSKPDLGAIIEAECSMLVSKSDLPSLFLSAQTANKPTLKANAK